MTKATEYVMVPADLLEDRQTGSVHDLINKSARAKAQAAMAQELNRQRAELEEEDRADAVMQLIVKCSMGLAAIGTLVFLAHIGAIAGWVMHLSTMALTGWMGYEIGRIGGHKYD